MDNTYSWQNLFQRQHHIRQLSEGPFGSYIDEFAVFIQGQHYGRRTIQRALCSADRFARWLMERDLQLSDAHEATLTRYRNSLGRCEGGGWPHRVKGLHLAVRFLEAKGIGKRQPALPIHCSSPIEECLGQFDGYLERVVGAARSTRQRYRPILLRFAGMCFGSSAPDWSLLSADNLTAFILGEAAHAKGFGRKVLGSRSARSCVFW